MSGETILWMLLGALLGFGLARTVIWFVERREFNAMFCGMPVVRFNFNIDRPNERCVLRKDHEGRCEGRAMFQQN